VFDQRADHLDIANTAADRHRRREGRRDHDDWRDAREARASADNPDRGDRCQDGSRQPVGGDLAFADTTPDQSTLGGLVGQCLNGAEPDQVTRHDAILVDEGQDLLPAWWNALRLVLADPSARRRHIRALPLDANARGAVRRRRPA
jgi:hypothetical protein